MRSNTWLKKMVRIITLLSCLMALANGLCRPAQAQAPGWVLTSTDYSGWIYLPNGTVQQNTAQTDPYFFRNAHGGWMSGWGPNVSVLGQRVETQNWQWGVMNYNTGVFTLYSNPPTTTFTITSYARWESSDLGLLSYATNGWPEFPEVNRVSEGSRTQTVSNMNGVSFTVPQTIQVNMPNGHGRMTARLTVTHTIP